MFISFLCLALVASCEILAFIVLTSFFRSLLWDRQTVLSVGTEPFVALLWRLVSLATACKRRRVVGVVRRVRLQLLSVFRLWHGSKFRIVSQLGRWFQDFGLGGRRRTSETFLRRLIFAGELFRLF